MSRADLLKDKDKEEEKVPGTIPLHHSMDLAADSQHELDFQHLALVKR